MSVIETGDGRSFNSSFTSRRARSSHSSHPTQPEHLEAASGLGPCQQQDGAYGASMEVPVEGPNGYSYLERSGANACGIHAKDRSRRDGEQGAPLWSGLVSQDTAGISRASTRACSVAVWLIDRSYHRYRHRMTRYDLVGKKTTVLVEAQHPSRYLTYLRLMQENGRDRNPRYQQERISV